MQYRSNNRNDSVAIITVHLFQYRPTLAWMWVCVYTHTCVYVVHVYVFAYVQPQAFNIVIFTSFAPVLKMVGLNK